MAVVAPVRPRPAYFDGLPTLTQAAAWMEVAPSSVGRALRRLSLDPLEWGREKRLDVEVLLLVAGEMRRYSPGEIAGDLVEHAESVAPEHAAAIRAEAERVLLSWPEREPTHSEAFIADLYASLPEKYAKVAEALYRRSYDGRTTKGSPG